MTDPDLTPADGDTPGPFATPAQDADVRALLGTLRAEDVPMPDDVVRRINAAVVAERVASTLPDSPAALVDPEDGSAAGSGTGRHASVTVLPSAEERRGPSYARLTKLVAAAAAVLVVVGVGGALVKGTGGLSADSTSAGGASAAPESANSGGAAVKASGLDYTASSLTGQVRSLVGGSPQAAPVSGQTDAAATPQPSVAPGSTRSSGTTAYHLSDRTVLAACVTALTGGTSVEPVAVDQGTYEGKPAEIVVLPTTDDASYLDVWVVAPGCGSGPEPQVLEFQRVAR